MNAAELHAFHTSEARAVQGPYLVLAGVVLIWALMVWLTRFPAVATGKVGVGEVSVYRFLLRNRDFMLGVAEQLFLLGWQVVGWELMIHFGQAGLPGTGEK